MSELPGYLGASAAIWAAGIAHLGLNTWRAQLQGSTEYDLARRTLRRVYELRDAVAFARSPFISAGEFATARQEAGRGPAEDSSGPTAEDSSLVYERRWAAIVKARRELDVDLLEAEVLWGPRARECVMPVNLLLSRLLYAIQDHLRELAHPGPTTEKSLERSEKQKLVLWSGYEDPEDSFQKEFGAAIQAFELLLRPHLNPPVTTGLGFSLRSGQRNGASR